MEDEVEEREEMVPNVCCDTLSRGVVRPSLRKISSDFSGFFMTGGGCLLSFSSFSSLQSSGKGGGGVGAPVRGESNFSQLSSLFNST